MQKILFSDLDGTIIGKDAKPLHEKNLEALQALRNQGHLVALCTGRNNIDLLPTLKITPIPYDYLVLCNGAYITDRQGQVLYEKDIPLQVGRTLLRKFMAEERLVTYFCDGTHCYMKNSQGLLVIDDKGDIHTYQDHSMFSTFLEQAPKFTIIGINQEDEKTDFLDDYVNRILPSFNNEISWFYNMGYIDIMASGSSKGNGMKHLYELLELDRNQVYAIGDSFNDISMIELAGHGMTFHRSPQVVKEHANHLVNHLFEVLDWMTEK